MSWTAIIHAANAESGTSPYNEIALSTVSALTGYNYKSFSVTAVHETPEGSGGLVYASGAIQQSRIARRTYALRTEPYDFATERTIGTTDLYYLLQMPYLWVELNTTAQDSSVNVGTTSAYHTADYVIPVTIDGFNVEHLDESGKKVVTVNLKHRFYNQ